MNEPARFILDANCFISRHYAVDICPGYRDSLVRGFAMERLVSIEPVREELLRGNDELRYWTENDAPDGLFRSIAEPETQSAFVSVVQWAESNERNYLPAAKRDFLAGADPWLVAFAIRCNGIIVTSEVSAPLAINRIKLPDAAGRFDVECMTPEQMLRQLGFRFVLDDPSAR